MFPEDVNLNIISFLGLSPRKRCWCRNENGQRCKKSVTNTNQCIFCHIHEKARFTRPLFKPYEDLLYIVPSQKNISHPTTHPTTHSHHRINGLYIKIERNFQHTQHTNPKCLSEAEKTTSSPIVAQNAINSIPTNTLVISVVYALATAPSSHALNPLLNFLNG